MYFFLSCDLRFADRFPFMHRLTLLCVGVVGIACEPHNRSGHGIHQLHLVLSRFESETSHVAGGRDLKGTLFSLLRLLRALRADGPGVGKSRECEDDAGQSCKNAHAIEDALFHKRSP
jgi:hypothetical protein